MSHRGAVRFSKSRCADAQDLNPSILPTPGDLLCHPPHSAERLYPALCAPERKPIVFSCSPTSQLLPLRTLDVKKYTCTLTKVQVYSDEYFRR
jgi:hypothetical protein